MAGTFIFGILFLLTPAVVDWGAASIYLKLMLDGGLSHFHHLLARGAGLAADRKQPAGRFYRFANEVPTALMILIVILIVVRPF